MKNILIIVGHPNTKSLCSSFAQQYCEGANEAGHHVELLELGNMNFNPNFMGSYSSEVKMQLEPDLIYAQQKIKWAHHIVIVHPVWWGSVPAILKGFFDKVLTPGFAFKYKENSDWWDKLLQGKTGEIIYTADTPIWVNRFIFLAPSVNVINKRVFAFCGIKTKRIKGFGPVRGSDVEQRKKWLTHAKYLGSTV